MTAPTPPIPAQPAPNGGAWLGLAIAARAALSVAMGAATLAAVASIPLLVDAIASSADASELPPQAAAVLDLMLDAAAIVRPYARVAGGSAVVLGFALFVAAAMLVRGSETARKATRALLVAEAVHSAAAAAWLAVLCATSLAEWNLRYRPALAELIDMLPSGGRRPPALFHAPGWLDAAFCGVWGLVSASVVVLLCWLAGRPLATQWCEARRARSPIASPGGPR